jgi:uncharacterized protein (TIGR00369 family)
MSGRETSTSHLSPLERLQYELTAPPYHAYLRPEAVSADPEAGTVEIRLPFRPEFQRTSDRPEYHGGVIAGLADLTAHAAAAVKVGHMAPTIDLRIDFMRVGTGDLLARGMVRRSGRTLATVDVEITGGDGRIVALARGVLSVAA